jgi:hypothetical protein
MSVQTDLLVVLICAYGMAQCFCEPGHVKLTQLAAIRWSIAAALCRAVVCCASVCRQQGRNSSQQLNSTATGTLSLRVHVTHG